MTTKTELRTLIDKKLESLYNVGWLEGCDYDNNNTEPDEPIRSEKELRWCNKTADYFLTLLEDTVREARMEEASHYCDEGHFHDKERDLAMLPSERLVELKEQGRASSRPSAAKPSQDSEVQEGSR